MKYLVWSNEKAAWWKPNAGGYTIWRSEAARVSLEKATEWALSGSTQGDVPEDLIVPEREGKEAK